MKKALLVSALLASDVSASYVCTDANRANGATGYDQFITVTCPTTCAIAVCNSLTNIPSSDSVLSNVIPAGLDLESLAAGDTSALLAVAGIELPAGLDANALAAAASGDFSGLDLNALTGGMIPEGLDIGVIQALIGGDLTALAKLDINALLGSLGINLNVGGIDFGAIISGLLGTSVADYSVCDKLKVDNNLSDNEYNRCKADKDYADEQEKQEAQAVIDNKFVEQYESPRIATNGLECTMDGMVDMVQKTVELMILPITLVKELTALAMASEPGLQLTVQLVWTGFLGSTFWGGYALYAVYAVGLDYGFGDQTCDTIDYLYLVIKELAVMTTFAAPTTTT